jgi:hypothetical protein
MKVNVGSADKVIRIVAGVAAIGWGVYAQNWLGAIGIIPLATAAMGWCPLYSIFGIKTCSMKKD